LNESQRACKREHKLDFSAYSEQKEGDRERVGAARAVAPMRVASTKTEEARPWRATPLLIVISK
jgi:hypothetical protein